MASKKSKPIENPSPLTPEFPVGARVLIARPHLWANCEGSVVSVSKEGLHRIRVDGKDGATFQTDAWAVDLKPIPSDLDAELEKLREGL